MAESNNPAIKAYESKIRYADPFHENIRVNLTNILKNTGYFNIEAMVEPLENCDHLTCRIGADAFWNHDQVSSNGFEAMQQDFDNVVATAALFAYNEAVQQSGYTIGRIKTPDKVIPDNDPNEKIHTYMYANSSKTDSDSSSDSSDSSTSSNNVFSRENLQAISDAKIVLTKENMQELQSDQITIEDFLRKYGNTNSDEY